MSYHGSTGRRLYPTVSDGNMRLPDAVRHASVTIEQRGGSVFDCCNGAPGLASTDPHSKCDWIDFCRGCYVPCVMGPMNSYGNYQAGEDFGSSVLTYYLGEYFGWVPHMYIRQKLATRLNNGAKPQSFFDFKDCCCLFCCGPCTACQGIKALRSDTTTAAHDPRVNRAGNKYVGQSSSTGDLIGKVGGGMFSCCQGPADLADDANDSHSSWDCVDFCKGCIMPCFLFSEANAFGDYQAGADVGAACIMMNMMPCCHGCAATSIRRKVEARLNGGTMPADDMPTGDICMNCFCFCCSACQTIKAVRAVTTRRRMIELAQLQPPLQSNHIQEVSLESSVGAALGGAIGGKTGAAIGGAVGGMFHDKKNKVSPK